jgi:hypothetical protein
MSHAAEIPHFPENDTDTREPAARADVHPFPELPSEAGEGALPPDWSSRKKLNASEILTSALDSVSDSMARAYEACVPYLESSAGAVRRVGKRLREKKEQKPLQMLAYSAGAAFGLGLVLRLIKRKS